MKSKETIQILSEIANSLDNYSLYKEATTVTRLMTKIAQDTLTNESESESKGGETLAEYNADKPMPKPQREAYYKKTIIFFKEQLLEGRITPEQAYATIYGNGPDSLQEQTVPKGFLTDEEISAFKKQFGRILRELQVDEKTMGTKVNFNNPKTKQKFTGAASEIHGMIDAYLNNRKLKVKDLENTDIQNQIIENLSKQLGKKHPGQNGFIELLRDIVTGYSRFEYKPNVGNKTPEGSTPPRGGGPGDVRFQDRTRA